MQNTHKTHIYQTIPILGGEINQSAPWAPSHSLVPLFHLQQEHLLPSNNLTSHFCIRPHDFHYPLVVVTITNQSRDVNLVDWPLVFLPACHPRRLLSVGRTSPESRTITTARKHGTSPLINAPESGPPRRATPPRPTALLIPQLSFVIPSFVEQP